MGCTREQLCYVLMVATRGGSSLLSVDRSRGQRCNGKIVAEKGGISVGVESQVTECHAIKEGRRTTDTEKEKAFGDE